ncbi:hypothetical protein [Rheinheimera sp.]|uniref:hypothetical protein n=1 Tax=Rheinheimera sp. TaxID=1869214 RepID=UPI004048BB00
MLDVHPGDYYAWSKKPNSKRDKTNRRLAGLIKPLRLELGCVYGYRKIIHADLRNIGERCGVKRV